MPLTDIKSNVSGISESPFAMLVCGKSRLIWSGPSFVDSSCLELCGEQSRYFDLIRWGTAEQTINAERAAEPGDGSQPFQNKNVLLPIPDVEKNYNPNVAKDIQDGWN